MKPRSAGRLWVARLRQGGAKLAELREDAARLRRDGVVAFVRAVGEAGRQLGENAQPRLTLETLLLGAPVAGAQVRR
ncbi:MAG: hypothetical protein IIA91_10100 [Chloroflexi bacterium]|nr:hypothetical protein [Chloroflexota bacterium]